MTELNEKLRYIDTRMKEVADREYWEKSDFDEYNELWEAKCRILEILARAEGKYGEKPAEEKPKRDWRTVCVIFGVCLAVAVILLGICVQNYTHLVDEYKRIEMENEEQIIENPLDRYYKIQDILKNAKEN